MSFNSINKVTILGRLGRDPEVKMMGNGNKLASFSVATNTSWVDKTGEKKELTDWHNVVIYNQPIVNFVESYIKKSSRVYIEGSLKTRKWTDKTENDRYTTEIILSAYNSCLIALDGHHTNKPASFPQESFGSYDFYSEVKRKKEETSGTSGTSNVSNNHETPPEDFIPF